MELFCGKLCCRTAGREMKATVLLKGYLLMKIYNIERFFSFKLRFNPLQLAETLKAIFRFSLCVTRISMFKSQSDGVSTVMLTIW